MLHSVLFRSPKTNSKSALRMISCDLFFFRFKNTWQFSVAVLRKLHYAMKLWKIISLTLPIFSQCVPGCLNAPRGSEKNKTKYFRLRLSDTERAKRKLREGWWSQKKSLSRYLLFFRCFNGIFLFHLRCLENPFLPDNSRCQDSSSSAPHPRRMYTRCLN